MPMMQLLTRCVKSAFWRLGIHVGRADSTLAGRRRASVRSDRITGIIDVGANRGEFIDEVRRAGFRGPVLAVEPLSEPFAALRQRVAVDGNLTVVNCALGSGAQRSATMHVTANEVSSSLLKPSLRLPQTEPSVSIVRGQQVEIKRLDDVVKEAGLLSDRLFLKLDVQGFEAEVLRGGSATLANVVGLQCELSTEVLYQGQPLAAELLTLLDSLGFYAVWVEPGFRDPLSGDMLQFDALFRRKVPAATRAAGPD